VTTSCDHILSPQVNKFLSKIVKSLVESAHSFTRWMHGTCIETQPVQHSDDEDPVGGD
jgi:hypothetical protein